MCDIVFLEKDLIYIIHENTLIEFGGEQGNYDYTEDRIESILAQQYSYFGQDKYPSVFKKAAMLLYFLTKGHCFVDGNKRLGIMSAMVFLDLNHYEPTFTNEDGYNVVMGISKSNFSGCFRDKYIECLAFWIEKNSVKKQAPF